jgi:hypothetical protein
MINWVVTADYTPLFSHNKLPSPDLKSASKACIRYMSFHTNVIVFPHIPFLLMYVAE